MRRKNSVLAVLLILLPAIVLAQHMRAVTPPMGMPPGDPNAIIIGANGTVTGLVTSVSGSTLSLANGLVTIDATGARYVFDHGPTFAVTPGMLINAVVDNTKVSPNAPLKSSMIFVTTLSQVTLNGPVTSVDVARSTITLLGRTIDVNNQTKITPPTTTLADIKANQLVNVTAGASGSTLLATALNVSPLFLTPTTFLHGTIKSIGMDSWVITTSTGDVTVQVPLHTPMAGADTFKVGDVVDVIVRVDAAGNYVAIVIMKSMTIIH